MKSFGMAAMLALFAAPAMAQQDLADGMAQMMKQFLQLNDEQTTKVKEILKKQNEDVRALLTEDQKQRYDQMSRMFGGAAGGRGGFGGFGGFGGQGGGQGNRGGFFPSTDDLKTQLSLTDDQVTKINEVRDAVRQDMRTYFQNQQGNFNQEAMQAHMQKVREEATKKVRDLLTDEQKPKFDEAMKAFATQQPAAPQFGGGNQGGRGGGSVDERVTRAMEALKITNAQEADAVKGLVRKVIELMEKQDTIERDARSKISDAARNSELSDEAVGDRLDEVRKGVRDIDKELTAARKELSDVVTNRQELELVRARILR